MADNPAEKEWGFGTSVSDDGRMVFISVWKGSARRNGLMLPTGSPAPAPQWQTLVAETSDAMIGATAVGGRFIVRYLRDASTLVRVHAADGKAIRDVALPGVGSANGFGGRWNDDETFFSYTSLITPADIYRLNVATGEVTLFRRPATAFDPAQHETRRAFVTS